MLVILGTFTVNFIEQTKSLVERIIIKYCQENPV